MRNLITQRQESWPGGWGSIIYMVWNIQGINHNVLDTVWTHLPSNISTNFDGSTDTQIDKKMESVAHLKVTLYTTKLAHKIFMIVILTKDIDYKYYL